MNVIAEIQRINQAELDNGSVGTSASWHAKYADSAWVFVGNLPMQLTEGDVICVMSQFGEVEDINLVRDEDTGKSKGFAFLKYEDARSCILAVDNLTGSKVCFVLRAILIIMFFFFLVQLSNISLTHALSSLLLEYVQILGRSIRVDHVENYRLPKHLADRESGENGNGGDGSNIDKTGPGHAYQGQELASSFDISKGQDLFGGPQVDKSTEKDERLNRNGEEDNMSKEERRQAKRARKEARDEKRREKEQRRMRKEEKRRERRARKMKGDSGESASNDDGEYGDSRRARQKEDG